MDELQIRKVAEHNDLITSIAKMDKTPLKIFELAVSHIDTKEPPKDNVIYLSKRELFSFLMFPILINIVDLKKQSKRCKNKLILKLRLIKKRL
ncbi:replication initiation protein [Lactococcus lactis]|nr:replication initiation protein [Lactococcus lactis]